MANNKENKPQETQKENQTTIKKEKPKTNLSKRFGANQTKPELLAPVGNLTNLKIAIDAGADAVYFGLKMYSLRTLNSTSKNFSLEDLEKVKSQCQRAGGIKRYLTLNSIIY